MTLGRVTRPGVLIVARAVLPYFPCYDSGRMPFRDIVGHRVLLPVFSRAVANDSLPPSLILAGIDGVGKRTIAMSAAQAMNCTSPLSAARKIPVEASVSESSAGQEIDACGKCQACRRIADGVYPDVHMVSPGEGDVIRIEQVRAVIEQVGYRPFEGRRRVVIIDSADQMVPPAQNALLKTLEEPPPSCQLFLVTSRPDMLLDTVRSRCPQLRFGPLSVEAIVRLLMVVSGFDEHAARAAAVSAGGSLRRAQQTGAGDFVAAREAAVELLETVSKGPDSRARLASAKILFARSGSRRTAGVERRELRFRLDALASLIRDMEVVASRASEPLANADLEKCLRRLAADFGRGRGIRAFSIVDRAMEAVASNASPKVVADWIVCNL